MRSLIAASALVTALLVPAAVAAFDEAKYPDWKGQWRRAEPGPPRYDSSRSLLEQQAPLTEKYKLAHAASLADQAAGGQGNDPTYSCIAPGMPRIMNVYDPMEIVITPDATHILIQHVHDSRRIFTDGRDWPDQPDNIEPTFSGYSIGRWIDSDGDGRYDLLEIETPPPPRTSGLRRNRPAASRGQPDHRQRTNLRRQIQSGHDRQ